MSLNAGLSFRDTATGTKTKISKRTWELIENKQGGYRKRPKTNPSEPDRTPNEPAVLIGVHLWQSVARISWSADYTSTVNAFSVRCTGL